MSAHAIAEKFRRALRNGTGATFSLEQLREMAEYGLLVELSRIEANELWPVKPLPGDTSASETLPHSALQTTGTKRRQTPEEQRAYIAELSRGL